MTKELSGKRETGACENCGNGSHWKIGEKSPNLKFAGAIEGKLYTIGKVRFILHYCLYLKENVYNAEDLFPFDCYQR